MTLDNLLQKDFFLTTVIDDFDAKFCNWYSHDKTSLELAIGNITSKFGLHQFINEPTHLLQNSFSCIDLIFTSQPNAVVKSDFTHPFIQIVIIKLHLLNSKIW